MPHRTPVGARATLVAGALFPLAVAAVPFVPDTAGWYQVQDPTTYVELCTASAPCDLPAGTLVMVIDFGTSPATRSTTTVPGGPAEGDADAAPRYTVVSKSVGLKNSLAGGGAIVSLSCPTGTVATSGTCLRYEGPSIEPTLRSGSWNGAGDRNSYCLFDDVDGELREARMSSVCVSTPTVRVLPTERIEFD